MSTNGDATTRVVPVRHVKQWIGVAVAMVVLAMIIHTLLSKVGTGTYHCHLVSGIRRCVPLHTWRFSWNIVGQYLTTSEIFHGLLVTIELTVIAMVVGISLGMTIAIMRMSPNRVLSASAWSYTWFFRGTPVLVQLLFWANIAILYPKLTIGIPFLPVTFIHLSVNSIFVPFFAAIVALGLNEAAYMSEIARAGLLAVDEGQVEAASSLGMTRGQTLRNVVIPQAMRVIIPPTGNEVISMLKTSSLASIVSVTELAGAASNIYSSNYEIMPLLIVISIWYLIITTILSIGQYYLERYFAKGALRTPPPTPIQRMRTDIRGIASKFRTSRPAREGAR
jgi:polar amino acid transport system permease protein